MENAPEFQYVPVTESCEFHGHLLSIPRHKGVEEIAAAYGFVEHQNSPSASFGILQSGEPVALNAYRAPSPSLTGTNPAAA